MKFFRHCLPKLMPAFPKLISSIQIQYTLKIPLAFTGGIFIFEIFWQGLRETITHPAIFLIF